MDNLFWKNKIVKISISGEVWVDAHGFDGIYEVLTKEEYSLDRVY